MRAGCSISCGLSASYPHALLSPAGTYTLIIHPIFLHNLLYTLIIHPCIHPYYTPSSYTHIIHPYYTPITYPSTHIMHIHPSPCTHLPPSSLTTPSRTLISPSLPNNPLHPSSLITLSHTLLITLPPSLPPSPSLSSSPPPSLPP